MLTYLLILSAPDPPNDFDQYLMSFGTDYAEQTMFLNAIDDETITELMRIVCYDQPIYEDTLVEGSEWFGLTLDVDRSSILTNVRPNYDQAAIIILDNDGNAAKINVLCYRTCNYHSYFLYYLTGGRAKSNNSNSIPSQRQHGTTSRNHSMESGPRQTSSFSLCYSSTSCTGSIIAASSARDCCAGTDDGLSFSDGEECHVCIGIIIIIINKFCLSFL